VKDGVTLSYTELVLIRNSDVDCAGICVRIILLIVYLSEGFFWQSKFYVCWEPSPESLLLGGFTSVQGGLKF